MTLTSIGLFCILLIIISKLQAFGIPIIAFSKGDKLEIIMKSYVNKKI